MKALSRRGPPRERRRSAAARGDRRDRRRAAARRARARCCSARTSTRISRTTALHFVVFGIVGARRVPLGSRPARRPTAAATPASCSSRWPSWPRAASWRSTRRDAGRPLHERARRLQGRDPGRTARQRTLRGGVGVRRPRPGLAPWLMRRRGSCGSASSSSMGVWFVWTVAGCPRSRPGGEAAQGSLARGVRGRRDARLRVSAARYWQIFRHGRKLLPAAVVACFVLLAEAMIGVALTGEREVARELVGVARADRQRLPRHRLRRAPRVARRAVPARSTCRPHASVTRRSASSSATSSASRRSPSGDAGGGRGDARRVLEHRRAADHAASRRRAREVHRRRHRRHLQRPRRSAGPRARAARAALALQERSGARRRAPGVAADARRRQHRRGGAAGDRRRRATSRIPSSATRSTRRRGSRASRRPAAC